jgi:hypothetical protein
MSRASQHSSRQKDNGLKKLEHTVDGDPDDPERKREEPHYGIKHERQKGQWPAEEQKEKPEQEFDHFRSIGCWMTASLCLYVPDEQVLQLTFGASFCKLQNEDDERVRITTGIAREPHERRGGSSL